MGFQEEIAKFQDGNDVAKTELFVMKLNLMGCNPYPFLLFNEKVNIHNAYQVSVLQALCKY